MRRPGAVPSANPSRAKGERHGGQRETGSQRESAVAGQEEQQQSGRDAEPTGFFNPVRRYDAAVFDKAQGRDDG